MHQNKLTTIAFFLFISAISIAQSKTEVLTNKSIIDLVKAGLSNNIIISKISSSTCKFDVSTNGLITLKKEGVNDELVQTIMDKANGKVIIAANPVVTSSNKTTDNAGGLSAVTLINHVYVYNKAKESALPLEKSVAVIRVKQGMFGGSIVLEVGNEKSEIRLTIENANSFVINTGLATMPELILYKVKTVKKMREVTVMKANSSGAKSGENTVTLNTIKLKDGIYQVTPGIQLKKGEYFFTTKPGPGDAQMDAFAFGID